MDVLHINHEAFKKLTSQSDKAVLIDFWATWCGPCKNLAPELDALAKNHDDLIVAKIDVDDPANVQLAVSLGVDSIPAMFFYRNGKLEKRFVGYMTKAELETKLGI